MRIIDGKRVLFDAADVAKFRAVWPCNGLDSGPYWFEFDWRGDLVDHNLGLNGEGSGAASALADDARAFISSGGAVKPDWASA